MTAHPYHKKLARILDRMGGVYTVSDIMAGIASGRMQSFVEGDSWAITKIVEFPRCLMLEVMFALGSLEECRILHDRIMDFALENDIDLVQAYGRKGWKKDAAENGWKIKTTAYLYQREP
jgi:hypothetical protein